MSRSFGKNGRCSARKSTSARLAVVGPGVRVALPLLGRDAPLLRSLGPVIDQMEPAHAPALLQALTRLELIRREGSVTMLPLDLVIH